MEVSIFPLPDVRALKSQFVEARLHSDTKDPELHARIAGLVETVAQSTSQPIYVVVNPVTEKEVDRFKGAVLPGNSGAFVEFLSDMLEKLP